MEQRLFIAACIMYLFSWISKRLFRKNKLDNKKSFAYWNSIFLWLILGCAYYIISFIVDNTNPVMLNTGISIKKILTWIAIFGVGIYGFFYALQGKAERRDKIIKANMDWANTVYFAGFVASIVMFFFVQAFKIPSASMYNTLQIGDHLFVNKAVYGFRIPLTQIRFGQFKPIQKGDIIIFSFPATTKNQINCGGPQYGRDYVKRVVALPGDKVEVKEGSLYINDQKEPLHGYEVFRIKDRLEPVVSVGDSSNKDLFQIPQEVYQQLWESRKLEHELGISLRDNFGPVIVPEGQYFAMGDNRDDSCDSRFWGPVPRENIKGTAWFIHWPLKHIRLIH